MTIAKPESRVQFAQPQTAGERSDAARAPTRTLFKRMPAFALDAFEAQAEAFLRARAWREWQFLSGQRPGRGLLSLYEEDFKDVTSIDLWADLQAAAPDTSQDSHK